MIAFNYLVFLMHCYTYGIINEHYSLQCTYCYHTSESEFSVCYTVD